METLELPSVEKSGIANVATKAASACCIQPVDQTPCCTPNESAGETGGDCCEQPGDGSACCSHI